jgi:hypothetical protein
MRAYPRGRPLGPLELADYKSAILLLRLRLRPASAAWRYVNAPQTAQDLAMQLGLARSPELARRRLFERVQRLLDLLPPRDVCSNQLKVKVSTLELLGSLLQQAA